MNTASGLNIADASIRGTDQGFPKPTGTTPPSGSRGNDELRTPCAIRALLLGKRLSVAVNTSAWGKAARAAAEVDPGDGQGCSRSGESPG